ncbi:hypothetical protein ACHAXS_006469 [Conticribra weissflogii]
MRRPAEQTKLLFLYFLRSTAAALATPRPFSSGPHPPTPAPPPWPCGGGAPLPRSWRLRGGGSGGARLVVRAFRRAELDEASSSSSDAVKNNLNSSGSGSSHSRNDDPPLLKHGHLTFRLARRTDVPQIQQCNLATLPENYNHNFYVNHLRTWPELCLVAEHVPEDFSADGDGIGDGIGDDDGDDVISSPWEFYSNIEPYSAPRNNSSNNNNSNNNINNNNNKKQKEIVGYILGKVEERPVHPPPRQVFPPSRVADPPPLYNLRRPPPSRSPSSSAPPAAATEKIGHVTSLAVHSHARRLGIASSLLHQLHYHLRSVHRCRAVGLHVRISNRAAVRLYVEGMGYHVADIIPMYYGDGEDAYFMRKELEDVGEGGDARGGGDAATGGGDAVGNGDGGAEGASPGRKRMRGERAREEWMHKRSATRDRLSVEERAWFDRSRGRVVGDGLHTVGSIGSSGGGGGAGLSGMVQNGFRSLWSHAGDGTNPSSVIPGGGSRRFLGGNRALPPWETGPEELRLPRYRKIVPRDEMEDTEREEEEKRRRDFDESSCRSGNGGGKEGVPVAMEVQELQQPL